MTRIQAELAKLIPRAVDPNERRLATLLRYTALFLANMIITGDDRLPERVLKTQGELAELVRAVTELPELPDPPVADAQLGLVN
jgi:hypothetical protein